MAAPAEPFLFGEALPAPVCFGLTGFLLLHFRSPGFRPRFFGRATLSRSEELPSLDTRVSELAFWMSGSIANVAPQAATLPRRLGPVERAADADCEMVANDWMSFAGLLVGWLAFVGFEVSNQHDRCSWRKQTALTARQ